MTKFLWLNKNNPLANVLLFALLAVGMLFALGKPMLILMLFGAVFGFLFVNWADNSKKIGSVGFYVALQFSYVWVTMTTVFLPFISPLQKLDYAIVLLSVFATVYFLWRDFSYFWKTPVFRFLLGFLIVGVVYFIGYKTDFIYARAITGYYGSASKDTNLVPASTIVFYSTLVPILSIVCSLNIFRNNQYADQILIKVLRFLPTLSVMMVIGCIVSNILQIKLLSDVGPATSLFMFTIVILFYIFYYRRFWGKSKVFLLLGSLIPLFMLNIILFCNKTTLVAVVLLYIIYFVGIHFIGYHLPYKLFAKKIFFSGNNFAMIVIALIIGTFLFFSLGFNDMLADKMEYFQHGFSGKATLRIREDNWHFFSIEWLDHLDIWKTIFGFGLGDSRKTIFFVSAMRNRPDYITLVPTLHNSYLELMYDFGLMCLVYYGATIYLVIKAIRYLFINKHRELKLWGLTILTLVAFTSIYGLTDGQRIQVAVYYYAALGFFEGLSHCLERKYKKLDESPVRP